MTLGAKSKVHGAVAERKGWKNMGQVNKRLLTPINNPINQIIDK